MSNWFHDILHGKRFEPVKRKHGSTKPEWIGHRFPIRGGISLRDTIVRDFGASRNTLFDMVRLDGVQIGDIVRVRLPSGY